MNGNNLEEKKVLNILKPYLEDKSIKKIGQNIKFDYIIFYHRGIDINCMEDTMLMSYSLDAGKNRHNMDTLSEIHLGHKTIKFKVDSFKKNCLLNGLDDIALSLEKSEKISSYENNIQKTKPWMN